MNAPLLKTCTSCSESKPLTDFYHSKTNADGRKSKCRACFIREETSKRFGIPKTFTLQDAATAEYLNRYDSLEVMPWALDGVPAKPQEPITAYTWRGEGNGE